MLLGSSHRTARNFFICLIFATDYLFPEDKIYKKVHKVRQYSGGNLMPKPRTKTGEKNLISNQLIELRKQKNYSQRDLSYLLQLAGYDMDKNVITRIETNKRYVTDLELQALSQVFQVSYDYLIEGNHKAENT